jgi:nicotinamidase-related amidase
MANLRVDKEITALLVIDPYNDFISEGGKFWNHMRHVAEDWGSSGFANTDLDLQLKKHGIHKLIVIGLIARTCVEATVRFAAELGYEVTMVKDATADYSDEQMHAALDVNIPNYASAIVTTNEVVDSKFQNPKEDLWRPQK